MKRTKRLFSRKAGRKRSRRGASRLRFESLEGRRLMASASGDFNGDGYDDLAVGAPGEDLISGQGLIPDAGAVDLIHGQASGLGPGSLFWHQGILGGILEPGDCFGESLP